MLHFWERLSSFPSFSANAFLHHWWAVIPSTTGGGLISNKSCSHINILCILLSVAHLSAAIRAKEEDRGWEGSLGACFRAGEAGLWKLLPSTRHGGRGIWTACRVEALFHKDSFAFLDCVLCSRKTSLFIYARMKNPCYSCHGTFNGTINTIQCKLRKLRYQIKNNKTDFNLDNIFLLITGKWEIKR